MKKLFILISLLLISNTALAISLGDLKKTLEDATEEIKKEIETPAPDNSNSVSGDSQKKSNEDNTAQKTSNSDIINLPNSKFLTIEAFKKVFDNKILVLNEVENGPNTTDLILKVNVKQLANGTNYEQAGVDTDVYYKKNGKWVKEKLITFYWEDAFFCDSMARRECVSGGMAFQINAFDYIFGVMTGEQKSIGSTVTSKAGFKLVPTYEVQEGDMSYNPDQWRLISPNRFNDPQYAVLELSEDQNIIAQLESEINASNVAKVETEKKNEELKANQVGFNKKISLQCTYTTNQGINIETYQFEGKNVFWQGLGVELGVPYSEGDTGLFVSREGNSSIIKTKLDTSGMTLNYTIDVQNLQAEYILEGLNFKVLGTCIPL